jgi:hypothetical protein
MRNYTVEVILRITIDASSPGMAEERVDRIVSDTKMRGLTKQGWSSCAILKSEGDYSGQLIKTRPGATVGVDLMDMEGNVHSS